MRTVRMGKFQLNIKKHFLQISVVLSLVKIVCLTCRIEVKATDNCSKVMQKLITENQWRFNPTTQSTEEWLRVLMGLNR